MRNTTFIIITIVIFCHSVFSQNESNVWHFGQFAGMDFNSPSGQPTFNGEMNTIEGCSAISDENGNLLFYTNGVTVWNRNHNIMMNGTGLMGHESTSQSGLIVKKPLSDSIFYIFTIAAQAWPNGFRYSEVDLSLDNNLGAITANKNVAVFSPTCEQVIAVKHCNNVDFWIIVHEFNSNKFHCYLLTELGLNLTPVINEIGMAPSGILPYTNESHGQMKSSPNGKQIAMASMYADTVQVLDFNRYDGTMSYCIYINVDNPYGVEFSPNNQLLYVNASNKIYQYDLTYSTENLIATSQIQVGTFSESIGSLQRAVDNRIYIAKHLQNSLGVIENPDNIGSACSLNYYGPSLNFRLSKLGLPSFPNRYIVKKEIVSENEVCQGDSISFSYSISETPDSSAWVINSKEVSTNTTSMHHIFSDTGYHTVHLITYYDCYIDTLKTTVYVKPIPNLDIGDDLIMCEHSAFTLDASYYPNATYVWQDNSTSSDHITSGFGDYFVEVTVEGCIFNDTLRITECQEVVNMPNVFSPNSDGVNDQFIPIYTEGTFDEELFILNRWGQQLYYSTDIYKGWDGQFNGNESLEGNYFWKLNYKDKYGTERSKSGFFQLVR